MFAINDVDKMRPSTKWSNKKVLVIGIARQGIALARYLAHQGAGVIVNDQRSLDQLGDAMEELADLPVEWVVGSHPLSILQGVDLVCVSGGVPLNTPLVLEAMGRKIAISNDSQIFLEECPCKTVGITGSAGKTTTTTLVGLIAQASVEQMRDGSQIKSSSHPSFIPYDSESTVWIGGNIGSPLISRVDQMKVNDLAIMELSSFQLEVMESSPEIAAVLNITPNHLDRHGTMENYIAAKARIIRFQSSQDVAVLNFDDPVVRGLAEDINGGLVVFSNQDKTKGYTSVYFDPESQFVSVDFSEEWGFKSEKIIHRQAIPLRGEHNLMNVIGACAISAACGLPTSAMEIGVKNFQGIPHRLEFVRSWHGADWYNDSIATAPERTIAALNSFTEPIILLAGGRDKDLPWDEFASLVCQRVKHLILFGEAAGVISAALTQYEKKSKIKVTYCLEMREAVKTAATIVESGDVVLLSPGGTSFDEFTDFEQRGEVFKKWIMELE
jgi:UDP-N-acetylmuramoylalanine--D-glutamate ligase